MAQSTKERMALHRRRKVYQRFIEEGSVKVAPVRKDDGTPMFYIETSFTPEGWERLKDWAAARGIAEDAAYYELLRYVLDRHTLEHGGATPPQ